MGVTGGGGVFSPIWQNLNEIQKISISLFRDYCTSGVVGVTRIGSCNFSRPDCAPFQKALTLTNMHGGLVAACTTEPI